MTTVTFNFRSISDVKEVYGNREITLIDYISKGGRIKEISYNTPIERLIDLYNENPDIPISLYIKIKNDDLLKELYYGKIHSGCDEIVFVSLKNLINFLKSKMV